jgi:hypothetical protein
VAGQHVRRSSREAVAALAALLVLTAVVYLTRNAILRVRETQADAFAAAHDASDPAIAAVIARMPAPRAPWISRWGTHPPAGQRLDAVNDPRVLLRAGLWELAGVGLAAGALAANLGFLLSLYLVTAPLFAGSTVGLVAGGFMGGMLAVAVWRATARDPNSYRSPRTWLACPLALAAGYLAGSMLTLQRIVHLPTGSATLGVASWLVSGLVLVVGSVMFAVWLASAAGFVLASPDPPRRGMIAVVGAAVVVAAAWFAVWLPASLLEGGFEVEGGSRPAVGADISWYRVVATWSGAVTDPLTWMVRSPLMLLGLTLLWLVPVLAAWRGRRVVPLRLPLLVGLIGAVAVVVVDAALPFAFRASLAPEVRAEVDITRIDAVTFSTIYTNTVLAVASIVAAVVVAVVVASARRHRPVLALLAAAVTVTLSTAAAFLVADAVGCSLNIRAVAAPPTTCLRVPGAANAARAAHWIGVQGVVLAIPAALIGAAVGALLRRRSPRHPTPPSPAVAEPAVRRRLAGPVTAAVLVILVVAAIAATWLVLPRAYELWLEPLLG